MAEFDSVIPAGQSGKLTAKVRTTTAQSGPFSKSVAVTTDAPGAERLNLSVTFTIVNAVTVLPRPQVSLAGVEGDISSATVVLRRGDGGDLEIGDVVGVDERLEVSWTRVTDPGLAAGQQVRPGDVVLTVATRPGTAAAMLNGTFGVTTNHPDAERVDIAYGLRLRPVIEARPESLRLILQEGNQAARMALVRVQHNRREGFRITGIACSKPELLRANLVDGDVEQQVHTVAVMLQDDVMPGALGERLLESLVLTTDDPGRERLEVGVLVEPRELHRPGPPRPIE
ncbi:MAG: DUF1573 domain-containing protein [Thermoanaerobaculales bacterium]|nr:DUF1573 domain-containing protein [Thermoanaerobaculales bacterium]